MDHYNRKTLRLDKVQTVVLDEADRMLDMGFFDDVTKIIERAKNRKNLGLFSATISQEVMTVSWMYQRDEVEITVPADTDNRPTSPSTPSPARRLKKVDMAIRLIRTLGLERTIIFCNTKVMCQRLSDDLRRFGLQADCIHGDIAQQKREKRCAHSRKESSPSSSRPTLPRAALTSTMSTASSTTTCPRRTNITSTASAEPAAPRKGIAVSILGTFPEQAKLSEIAKYSHYQIQPVKFLEDGTLVEEQPKEKKAPAAPEVPPVRQTERACSFSAVRWETPWRARLVLRRRGSYRDVRARRNRRRRPPTRCDCQRRAQAWVLGIRGRGTLSCSLAGNGNWTDICLRRKKRA